METQAENKSEYTSSDSVDVAIWCAGIRTHLWLSLYESLALTNECSFEMFFCGHIRPKFELPSNLNYIYSEMTDPAPCAEIARRHAMATNSKYVTLFVDDMVLSPRFLDVLIEEIESHEGDIVVGPGFKPVLPGQPLECKTNENGHINGDVTHDRGLGVVFPTMRRALAERMGGIDKRFRGIFWDYDLLLRLHVPEITFKTCERVSIAEDVTQQFHYNRTSNSQSPTPRASHIWRKHDDRVLKNLWTWWDQPNFNPEVAAKIFDTPAQAFRISPSEHYSDDDLLYLELV